MNHPIFELYKIFDFMKINKYRDFVQYILTTEEYGILDKFKKNGFKQYQQGGGKEIPINYEGIEFIFTKYKDEEDTLFSLFGKDKSVDCLTIKIDKKRKEAIIIGIGYFPFCFTNKQIKHFKGKTSGSLLLKLALKLIDEMKEHYKYNKIILQDNSHKKCHGFDIELSKMYTLMYGDTWYGKYGFIPSTKGKIDNNKIKRYERNKKIMKETKMKDVPQLKNYLVQSFKNVKGAEDILHKKDKVMKLYEQYNNDNRSLKSFLKKFLEDYDKTCLLFYAFYGLLYEDLDLTDFQKQSYIKNI